MGLSYRGSTVNAKLRTSTLFPSPHFFFFCLKRATKDYRSDCVPVSLHTSVFSFRLSTISNLGYDRKRSVCVSLRFRFSVDIDTTELCFQMHLLHGTVFSNICIFDLFSFDLFSVDYKQKRTRKNTFNKDIDRSWPKIFNTGITDNLEFQTIGDQNVGIPLHSFG